MLGIACTRHFLSLPASIYITKQMRLPHHRSPAKVVVNGLGRDPQESCRGGFVPVCHFHRPGDEAPPGLAEEVISAIWGYPFNTM